MSTRSPRRSPSWPAAVCSAAGSCAADGGSQPAAAALAVVVVAGAGTAALVRATGRSSSVVTATGSCAEPRSDVLPTWARDGFSDPEPAVPYVLSEDGRMAAILFAPLQAPSAAGRNNKILWVTRPDSAGYPLDIAAVRAGSDGTVVHRHLGGPGPSIVDLPAARLLDAQPPVGRVPGHHEPRVRPALEGVCRGGGDIARSAVSAALATAGSGSSRQSRTASASSASPTRASPRSAATRTRVTSSDVRRCRAAAASPTSWARATFAHISRTRHALVVETGHHGRCRLRAGRRAAARAPPRPAASSPGSSRRRCARPSQPSGGASAASGSAPRSRAAHHSTTTSAPTSAHERLDAVDRPSGELGRGRRRALTGVPVR